jgi:glycosyltransferase involved in cell wall biosynthesis
LRRLFNIDKSKISSWNKYFINRQIFNLSKKINKNEKIDLIVGHESGIGDEAACIGRKLNIPSIFHLHGLYEYHKQTFGVSNLKKILSNLEKSTQIISVSKIAIGSYLNNGLENNRISIIPNLITRPDVDMQIENNWLDICKNKKVILCVGWFVEEKRIEQAINLVHELIERGDFILLIIGQGQQEKYLLGLIKQYDLENKIYIVGSVPPLKMPFFYKLCNFLIHPSIVDSFSMVCLEAMNNRRPIICTKNIGLTEYISDSKEGFIINPDNIAELKQKVLELLNNPDLEKTMGLEAFETSQKFYPEIVGEKIKEIYDRAITS